MGRRESPPLADTQATAAAMRRFDPRLTDAQVEAIARKIQEQRELGRSLAPKRAKLTNDIEPLTSPRT